MDKWQTTRRPDPRSSDTPADEGPGEPPPPRDPLDEAADASFDPNARGLYGQRRGPEAPRWERAPQGGDEEPPRWEQEAPGRAREAPPAGEEFPPPPRGDDSRLDFSALFVLIDALRRGLPPDLRDQFTTLVREALLTLRSVIDWYLDRLDRRPRESRVEDIPID